jgi:hypothetical protein
MQKISKDDLPQDDEGEKLIASSHSDEGEYSFEEDSREPLLNLEVRSIQMRQLPTFSELVSPILHKC